ncbi:Uric acid-xanthine permease [Exophiala dermatitidis]|uniref:NCS2 family nucleobase:cation symporter-2 n=1 Tax=Exophiala dermatitidis (strain ATCC 34100 / CBS 525.76 / NIH/UT8656) TaxID=858893 RepID=H6C2L7_EXODN|nr:NCS2 family nucleobase:cation symporter-2 [Exophiala dermatitidis NIH/UT8656]EHY57935.1 NCS2 family nucleobase:cation symporter-2 [Exophiala dermatitidis NIH/UT8656]
MGELQKLRLKMRPRRTLADRANSLRKTFCTRNGLLGNYDYAFLFRPNVPFLKRPRRASPFFGLDDPMPVVLAILLGFQHALAMLAGVMTPPIILAGQGGANLAADHQQYLVSTALIVSGILSAVQITRFNLFKSPYYLGTGLISVVGTSFSIIPVAQGAFSQMYANGYCPVDSNGNKLPCPEGYGALIGTCALCALIEMAIAFLPPKALQRVFPPVVTGPTVMMIGVHLIQSGFQDWAGGSGTCNTLPDDGFYRLCPNIDAPHALRWGSAEFIGLGFLVFLTIILCERFGSPIMKSTSVIIGLLVGCIVAAACGYFDDSGIKSAPVVSFVWVKTFPLSLYGPLVLPVLTFFIICACETIGDVTATCDVSRLEVEGPQFESRIQGGILADGLNGILAALMTITPMSTFAQNNGVIALTRCANRTAGYCCCMFLFIMGLFTKFSAALVAIPSAVLGGMTTFLYCAVAVSGMAIVNRVPFNRRTRFILTASLAVGYGSTLVPTWFDNVFTYDGGNHALQGFYNAIILVMETGFTITAFIAMVLNLVLPEDLEDDLEEDSVSKRSDCSSSVDEASKVQAQPSKEVV